MAEQFKDTSLNDVAKLGGMEQVGAGTFGGTIWQPTTTVSDVWKSTSLNDITVLGGMEEVGAGAFGGTIWVQS